MTITNSIFNGSSGSSNFSVTPLTASTVLPAATGSGVTYIYEVGSASPINLTSTTSTVGGVATFVASNHGAGAKLLVNDSAIGQWDVSEIGAAALSTLAYGRINANLLLASAAFPNTGFGALIPFNNTIYSSGATFSGTTGIIPANAGRYRASWLMVNGSEEFLDNGYFHVVQNGVSLGQVLYNMMEAAGVNQCAGFIDVDVVAGQAVSLYYRTAHTADDNLSWDAGSYFQLDQLPSTETVQVGTVVPTQLAFSHARASTAQTVADSTNVLVTIDTTISDSSGIFVSGTNRIVAATAGLYRIRGVVPWSTSGNPGIQAATILVNGVAVKSSSTRNNQPLAMTQVETTLLIAAGDYVQLRARQETGASLSTIITSTSLTNVYPELEVRQLPNSTVVNPEDVPVVDLDYVSYATTTIGGTLSTELISGHYYPQLDNVNWTHKVDTNVLLTLAAPPTGDSFTIKKAGLYAISVEMVANSYAEQTVYIFKNGTIVATGWANTGVGTSAMSQVGADVTLTLSVGDRIQFGSLIAAGWTASFSIRQLPLHSIVKYTPGDVVATTLNKFEARKDGVTNQSIPSGIDTDILFTALTASEGSGYNTATSIFTAPTAGWYSFDTAVRLDYNTAAIPQEMFILIKVNGIEKGRGAFAFSGNSGNANSYHYAQASVSAPLNIGDVVKVQCRQDTGLARLINSSASLNYFTGVQTATTSVVSPEAVPVSDLHYGRMFNLNSIDFSFPVGQPIAQGWSGVGPNNVGVIVNAAAGTLTATQAGTYKASVVLHDRSTNATSDVIGFYVNGTLATQVQKGPQIGSLAAWDTHVINARLVLQTNDVVTVRVVSGGTNICPGEFSLEQQSTHSIVKYTPGDVVVSDLARVRAETGATVTVTTTAQQVIYGTASTNVGGGYNTTTGIFTAPANGTYSFQVRGYWNFPASAQAGTDFILSLRVNGVSVRQSNTENPSSLAYQPSTEVSDTLTLSAGDQVSVWVVSGGTITGTVTFVCNNTWGLFTVDQQPTALLVVPGTVPVETLHRSSISRNSINSTIVTGSGWTTAYASMMVLPLMSGSDRTIDQNLMISGNTWVVKQAGRYQLSGFLSLEYGDAATISVGKNNTEFARYSSDPTATSPQAGGICGIDVDFGELSIGDVIDIRAVGHSGTIRYFSYSATLAQVSMHNIVAYTPGDVVVENLDHLFLYEGNNLSVIQTFASVAAQTGPDTLAVTGSRLDLSTPSSSNTLGVTATGSTVTITKAGRYMVDASINCYYSLGSTTRLWWQLVKNGSTVLSTTAVSDNSTSVTNSHNIVWSGTLAATDTLDLRVGVQGAGDVNVQNYSLRVEQMPTGMLVDPGTVPVQTISKLRVRRSGGTSHNAATGLYSLTISNTANKPAVGTVPSASGTLENTSRIQWTSADADLIDGNSFTAGTNIITSNYTGRVRVKAKVDGGLNGTNTGGNTWAIYLVKNGLTGTILDVSSGNEGTNNTYGGDTAWIDHEFDIIAGDTLDIRANSTAGNLFIDNQSIQIEMVTTSTVVNPGTVPVTPLSLASFSGSRGSNGVLIPGTVHTNEGSVLNTGTGLFTAPRSGRYRVAAFLHNGGSDTTREVTFNLVKNGAAFMSKVSAAMNGTMGNNILTFDRIITLAAGDTLLADIVYGGATYTNHFDITYQEVPTATVVDPGTLPVANLKKTVATRTTTDITISGSGVDVIFNTSVGGTIPYNTTTGVFTLTAGEEYQLYSSIKTRGTAAGYVQYEWVDAVSNAVLSGGVQGLDIHAPSALIEGSSPAAQVPSYIPSTNQTVKVRVTGVAGAGLTADQTRCIAYVRQLATQTIINPLATTTNDQAASGYVDIGTMRVQFFTANVQNGTAVTLPAPFANTNYRVTASVTSLSGVSYGGAQSKTTSGFQAIAVLSGSGYTSGLTAVDYIAVGLKP